MNLKVTTEPIESHPREFAAGAPARPTEDGVGPVAVGRPQGAAFLAEASRLLADSLDYETTLSTVAGLALPELGGWCIVDVVEEDGSARRLSVVHPDPDLQALAERLVDSWPPRKEDPIGVPAVIRTRRPEVIPRVTDDLLREVARGEDNLRILRALGIGSVVVLPLLARGRVMGAMSFITPVAGDRYTDGDVTLAQDLAARCALAIDNARLYRQAQSARLEAETAARVKSQFLAMTSHEIRTPINAVIGYTQLLEMGLAGPVTDEQRAHLERIHASSEHLLGLVNELLDLSKMEAGQVVVHREVGHLSSVVEAACNIIHGQVLDCEITLGAECRPEGGCRYVGDADRVRQIVVNLLANACKFTERGGRIDVRCVLRREPRPEARLTGEGPWACVDVHDTGIGIAAEHQKRIFDPFVQVSEGNTRTRDGTGLGLAIARQFARLMGGDLTVRSEALRGSTFTLWLPAAEDDGDGDGRGGGEADLRGTGGDGGAPWPGEPSLEARPAAQPRGEALKKLAALLHERMLPILETFTRRLRDAPPAPGAERLPEAALRNHLGSLLAEVSQMLALTHERGSASGAVVRDGTRILEVIAQFHGTQRRRLGWPEAALEADFRLLAGVVEEEMGRTAGGAHADRAPLEVFRRVLAQAERASRRGWQTAARRG
jgi:signal transduction histidine kinase